MRVQIPYTATAVVEKANKTEFNNIPTKEVNICTNVEGIPTFKIVATLCIFGRTVNPKGISLFHRRLMKMPAPIPTIWPVTVAIAAPSVSILGSPNHPKIKIGSRIKLVMDAADSVNKNSPDRPLAMTKRSNTHCPICPKENSIHTVRYCLPYSAMISFPPDCHVK